MGGREEQKEWSDVVGRDTLGNMLVGGQGIDHFLVSESIQRGSGHGELSVRMLSWSTHTANTAFTTLPRTSQGAGLLNYPCAEGLHQHLLNTCLHPVITA